jgi:hypothetical protein
MIAEAARRGQVDMSLVSADSTVARAHHDAAGMVVREEVPAALEEAREDEKEAAHGDERGRSSRRAVSSTTPGGKSGDAFGAGAVLA